MNMKNSIKNLIEISQKCKNNGDYETAYNLAEIAGNLIIEMACTINCISTWQNIGEELAEEYKGNEWVVENCKLYEFN